MPNFQYKLSMIASNFLCSSL